MDQQSYEQTYRLIQQLAGPRPRASGAKSLFSDHYLRHRLPEHPEWSEDAGEPLAALRSLYEEKRSILSNLNESQTEDVFIRPALGILGFEYIWLHRVAPCVTIAAPATCPGIT